MTLTRMALLAGLSTAMIATAVSAQTFREHFMTNWDSNSDGVVTLDEVKERRESMFLAFDANEDGYLDSEEQKALGEMRDTEQASMAEEGIQRPGGMGQGMGKGMGFGMNAQAGGMGQGRMIDTDGDGKFSRDEFVGMSQQWLARFDANGDGVISQDDF
jgi:uncharacterized protein (DUF2141 family)